MACWTLAFRWNHKGGGDAGVFLGQRLLCVLLVGPSLSGRSGSIFGTEVCMQRGKDAVLLMGGTLHEK